MVRKKLDISEVGYVKRYCIGNHDPTNILSNDEIEQQIHKMNTELDGFKGMILGQEKNFIMFQVNEHQVVMQYIVYHIGYKKKM